MTTNFILTSFLFFLSVDIVCGQIEPDPKPVIFEDHIVYSFVDTMPAFPGGEVALNKFIQKNITDSLREAGHSVHIIIFIDDKGNVKNPKIIMGDNETRNTDALKIIQKMPVWTPGWHKGETVYVWMSLKIEFRPLTRK